MLERKTQIYFILALAGMLSCQSIGGCPGKGGGSSLSGHPGSWSFLSDWIHHLLFKASIFRSKGYTPIVSISQPKESIKKSIQDRFISFYVLKAAKITSVHIPQALTQSAGHTQLQARLGNVVCSPRQLLPKIKFRKFYFQDGENGPQGSSLSLK